MSIEMWAGIEENNGVRLFRCDDEHLLPGAIREGAAVAALTNTPSKYLCIRDRKIAKKTIEEMQAIDAAEAQSAIAAQAAASERLAEYEAAAAERWAAYEDAQTTLDVITPEAIKGAMSALIACINARSAFSSDPIRDEEFADRLSVRVQTQIAAAKALKP